MRNILSAILPIIGGLFLGLCLVSILALARSVVSFAYVLLGTVAVVGTLFSSLSRGGNS